MRKVILFIASSADGYIARNNGATDWLFSDEDYGYAKFYASIDTVIMGRKTFDAARNFEKEPFKDKRCIVFSRQGKGDSAKAEFVKDPAGFTKKLRRGKGRNIWLVGGSEIISQLLDAGLIDEIINSVHPIVLGSGIPLFKPVKETKLALTKTMRFGSGLVQLHYSVKGPKS